jgi:hypothetical protein
VAFPANSLLCRLALGHNLADPLSFSVIRLVSGALILVPLARRSGEVPRRLRSFSSAQYRSR